MRNCVICGSEYHRAGPKRVCSPECAEARGTRKDWERQRKVGTINRVAVFERDNWICQRCGVLTFTLPDKRYHTRNPEADHIIPLADGGEHSEANMRCLCARCNRSRPKVPRRIV